MQLYEALGACCSAILGHWDSPPPSRQLYPFESEHQRHCPRYAMSLLELKLQDPDPGLSPASREETLLKMEELKIECAKKGGRGGFCFIDHRNISVLYEVTIAIELIAPLDIIVTMVEAASRRFNSSS
ncbi:hypothetical protein DFH09DRAFT_1090433 [Mycena vulgaris]|nr:hypothetical protein DFH09DRAFT_1090433 [Mycena vulgaris]